MNGSIWGSTGDSVLVRDGRIAAVGTAAEIVEQRAPGARLVDLRGRCVLPGFTDSHTHYHRTAILAQHFLDFNSLASASVSDVVEAVRERSARDDSDSWVQGDNLTDAALAERRFPTRWELDAVSAGHPVILRGLGKHVLVANSLALERAGIRAETPDPPGGRIDRDASGEPTGVLHERAKLRLDTTRLDTVVPPVAEVDRLRALQAGTKELHRHGITSIHEIARTGDELGDYQRLRDSGELDVRVVGYVRVIEGQSSLAELAHLGIRSGFGDDWLRLGGVKVSIDGSCVFRNAALYEDYPGHPGNRGLVRIEAEELNRTVAEAHRLGLRTAVHAIGPRAVDMALDAFRAAGPSEEIRTARHRIEHAYLAPRQGQFEAMRELGLVLSTQPLFIGPVGDTWIDIFDREYACRMMPLRTALDAGVITQANSDCPTTGATTSVLDGVRAAVFRTTHGGQSLGAQEAVTVSEALDMYTRVPAYSAGEEDRRGAIEPGRLADLTVLSADPRKAWFAGDDDPPRVVGTFVDGVAVFDELE